MAFFLQLLGQPIVDFLVSTVRESGVDAWRSPIETELAKLRAALPNAHRLVERCECWRLPKYNPIDELLTQLKDAVYEAETVTDELEYEVLKHRVEKSLPGMNLLKSWVKGLPIKVKIVLEKLDKVKDQTEETCNGHGIPQNPNQFSDTARPITSTFSDSLSEVCGREKELRDVICFLGVPEFGSGGTKRERKHTSELDTGQSSNKGDLSILSIVGIGGVGKTTLAQMVCNNKKVVCNNKEEESYFNLLIWVCVSDNFDLVRVTREIIESATRKECNLTNLNSLQEELEKVLESKRFLLVLDDVWSKEWQKLLGPLRGGSEGSAVMVTTRSHELVEEVGTSTDSRRVINLEGLEEDIYWEFFKSCAFGSNNCPPNELVGIGKEICGRLKGSPLAAKTIGGLLGTNQDVRHWENIKKSEMWRLQKEEHDILPVIQLSYQYLPSHLKKCFSFCSLYPKDFKFKQGELTKFWIMQGFIKSIEQQEVIAEGYFHDLKNRGFFLAYGGCHDVYVIHDLMHDVCQSITKDECFCIDTADFVQKASPDIRHVSVFGKKLPEKIQMELCRYEKLFSLSIDYPSSCCPTEIENWCNKLNRLRSLSLVKSTIKKLPESIENLKHLQFLDISSSNIEMLPQSFCNLYNIRYLNMEGCSKIETLPESFCSLYNLRYLNMAGCENIKCFPEGSNKLVNLEFFNLPYRKVSLVGHMKNLASAIQLNTLLFWVEADNNIENLKHMSKLGGVLRIYGLGNVPSKKAAEEAQLNKKPLIKELHLSWSRIFADRSIINEPHEEEVLESLCPHPNIRKLGIFDFGGSNISPSWLKQGLTLALLTEIDIRSCRNIFTIAHLPRTITRLHIGGCPKLTNLQNCLRPNHMPALKEIEISVCQELMLLPVETFGGFLSLEMLKIHDCPKLTCPNNAMVLPPSVKHLVLNSCGDLENSISSCLQNLTSLEELKIGKCPCLISIPAEATSNLNSLSELSISECAELQSLGGLYFLASLQTLNIWECAELQSLGGLHFLASLQTLFIRNCPKLQELKISHCPRLLSIPAKATSNLKSLSELSVSYCAKLQSLGGLHFLASVQTLNIHCCPKLQETGGRDINGKLPSGLLRKLHSSSRVRKTNTKRARN